MEPYQALLLKRQLLECEGIVMEGISTGCGRPDSGGGGKDNILSRHHCAKDSGALIVRG